MTTEHRVFGPPGTGKTHYLARQIERAAEEYGPEGVMVSSFTRAAATEIASRADLPDENVGTIHSFAWRMLDRPPIAEVKKQAALWNQEQPELALGAGLDVGDAGQTAGMTHADGLLAEWNVLRAQQREHAERRPQLQRFVELWEAWKQDTGFLDFTDLLKEALRRRHAPGAPQALFVDEAQDCTPLQWELLRMWSETTRTFVVAGDDDQILYEHLGADPVPFLRDVGGTELVLPQSYRLPQAVHSYAREWLRRHPLTSARDKEFLAREQEGAVSKMRASIRAPEVLVADIQDKLVVGETCMVLATCGYMLGKTLKQLREHAVPFHNPYRVDRGDWNPIGRKRGPASRIDAFLGDEGLWTPRQLHHWGMYVKAKGVFQHGAKQQLVADVAEDDADERYEEAELRALLTPEAMGPALAGDLNWFQAHLLQRHHKAHEYPLRLVRAHGRAVLRTRPSVIVGTIHSVKGGEADTVYVFPDLSRQGTEHWLGGDRDATVRQFYVAATRAREELVLCQAADEYSVRL